MIPKLVVSKEGLIPQKVAKADPFVDRKKYKISHLYLFFKLYLWGVFFFLAVLAFELRISCLTRPLELLHQPLFFNF
jgi:hypothetical protein